jgi:predicted enzyme related to lactoylglutathione lyase
VGINYTEIAFVVYPVSDMVRARAFYAEVLGLEETANWDDVWVEYGIGPGTLAITDTFPHLEPGAKGALAALEVDDFDAVLATLEEQSVVLFTGPFDTPACRGCSIKDPDGNEIILHARKEQA